MASGRQLVTVVLSLLLSGCFTSKDAVFDPADAVTPFAAGKYTTERRNDTNQWVSENIWPIKLDGGGYHLEDPANGGLITFHLFELDSDSYVIEESAHDEKQYGLLRVNSGAIFVYAFNCSDYAGSEVAKSYPPNVKSGGYISQCYFDDSERLFGAIRAYADKAMLVYRLTPVVELAAAPAPGIDSPPTPDMASLNLCNKSPLDIQAIVHHQHRNDPAKNMLSGWYDVPRGKCREVGQFPKQGLSVFGVAQSDSGRTEWPGQSKEYCISTRRTYRVVQEGEKCIPGEAARHFIEVSAISNSVTQTFGWK